MSLFDIREDYPPYVRNFLGSDNHGAWIVKEMKVCRSPVLSTLLKVLNVLTLGKLKRDIKKKAYDDLYHLYMVATIKDIYSDKELDVILEKNQVINIGKFKKHPGNSTCIPVKFEEDRPVSLFELLQKGLEFQKNTIGSNFFRYDVKTNNCQIFMMALILGNGIVCSECGSFEALVNFVKQDLNDLVIDPLLKLSKGITNLAAVTDKLVYGKGLEMV